MVAILENDIVASKFITTLYVKDWELQETYLVRNIPYLTPDCVSLSNKKHHSFLACPNTNGDGNKIINLSSISHIQRSFEIKNTTDNQKLENKSTEVKVVNNQKVKLRSKELSNKEKFELRLSKILEEQNEFSSKLLTEKNNESLSQKSLNRKQFSPKQWVEAVERVTNSTMSAIPFERDNKVTYTAINQDATLVAIVLQEQNTIKIYSIDAKVLKVHRLEEFVEVKSIVFNKTSEYFLIATETKINIYKLDTNLVAQSKISDNYLEKEFAFIEKKSNIKSFKVIGFCENQPGLVAVQFFDELMNVKIYEINNKKGGRCKNIMNFSLNKTELSELWV